MCMVRVGFKTNINLYLFTNLFSYYVGQPDKVGAYFCCELNLLSNVESTVTAVPHRPIK